MALIGMVEDIIKLVNIVFFKVKCLPMTYLGMPLNQSPYEMKSYPSREIWVSAASWKRLYLSKGWHILLKNAPSSQPT